MATIVLYLAIIFIVVSLAGGCIYLVQYWSSFQPRITKWWLGETKTKTVKGKTVTQKIPGRWELINKKLTTIIFKSLVFIFLPLFILVAMEMMGNLVFSVLLALALAFMVIVISSEITFKKPWKAIGISAAIGTISFAFPEIVSAPITLACWLMCTLGVILYLIEEVVEPNVFPKGLAVLCTGMLAINILQAISAVVLGHAVYLEMFSPPSRLEVLITEHQAGENISDLVAGDHLASSTGSFGRIHSDHLVGEPYVTTDSITQSAWIWLKTRATRHVTETPLLRHPLAEWSRFRAVMEELLHCWMWFLAQFLILLVSVPTDVQQWLAQKKKERKEGKKAEGSSNIEFFVLDLVNDFFVHIVYDNFFKKKG